MTDDARTVAESFVEFCGGLEQAGFVEYARRGRRVAALLFEAVEMLDAERSARRALQERCELQQGLLGKQADDALRRRP